jgi:Tfp pilus assembly protein PilP
VKTTTFLVGVVVVLFHHGEALAQPADLTETQGLVRQASLPDVTSLTPPDLVEGLPVEPGGEAPVAPGLEGRQRNPFRPFTLDLRPDYAGEPMTPLERYDLPQLRVAGVLVDLQPPRAMLEDNSGMGFIVIPGTPIGRNRGVVTAIETRRIVVEEKLLDFYGQEQTQRVVLEMPKDEEAQRDDRG